MLWLLLFFILLHCCRFSRRIASKMPLQHQCPSRPRLEAGEDLPAAERRVGYQRQESNLLPEPPNDWTTPGHRFLQITHNLLEVFKHKFVDKLRSLRRPASSRATRRLWKTRELATCSFVHSRLHSRARRVCDGSTMHRLAGVMYHKAE